MKNNRLVLITLLLSTILAAVLIAQNIPGAPPKPRARAVKLSAPQVLEAYVVAVLDGDTIDVVKDQQKTRVRLQGIDAPEKAQAFGSVSREHLASLVFNRNVRVLWSETDRYGRTLGKIEVDGKDVCLQMIEAGLAWHFKRYEQSQSPEDRIAYAQAEAVARQSKSGLWSDPAPVAPWDFRHPKGTK